MSTQLQALRETLESAVQKADAEGIEFWFARDLQEPLGYARWENFKTAVHRAIDSCEAAEHQASDHFRGVTKMIETGKTAQRPVEDYMLSRYACLLIAQNGDPRKPEIAFAQSYFAVQTRKQEIIEVLSQNIFERGVDNAGFGRIRSRGDQALFGGNTTQAMKDRYGIVASRPLADFLPALTIAAKNLATEMTNHNVQQDNLQGESAITTEHVQNNSSVRSMLDQRGIKPENLPAEEDLSRLERRVKADEKKLAKSNKALPGQQARERPHD